MDNKFLPSDLTNNYQFIVTVRNLASVYHNASVEKMDHVFFNGPKITLKPELINFLKERPASHAIITAEWSKKLVDMGYDEGQINDFESLIVIPGQDTLAANLAAYAQEHPDHSIYTAMDVMLKDYSQDPLLTSLTDMFQIPDAQVQSLFAMAYHFLDTMSPLEAELNLLVTYYEPHFDSYRDPTVFEGGAKTLGQISEMGDRLPSDMAEIASSYVLLRTSQLRQYAHLNLADPNIATSLQGFTTQLMAELKFLHLEWAGKDLKQAFENLVQPENIWLENRITSMEMSQDSRERKKGSNIRAAYLAIPCEERSQIASKMSQTNLVRSSPIGMLKNALDESVARFTLFDTLTRNSQHHLSQNYQEEYLKARSALDALRDDRSIDTDTNSSNSGHSTPL